MGVAAFAIAAAPVNAQEKPAAEKAGGKAKKDATEKVAPAKSEASKAEPSKGEKSNAAVQFRGTVSAKTDSSVTVTNISAGERTFQVTSETKLFKSGKPGTLADVEVGKQVSGSYREEGGKLVARNIRSGPKPEATEGEPKEKTDKAEKKAGKAEKPAKKN